MCGGIIVVPEGQRKTAALRNHRRIDPERIPSGWQHYKRANWHPWCLDYKVKLEKPSAHTLEMWVCAACGTDFEEMERTRAGWRRSMAWASHRTQYAGRFFRCRTPFWRLLESAGFNPDSCLVEADHIKPLWAGGVHQVRNLQILCQPCHKRKTKREARMRADARKGQLPLLGEAG